MTFLTQLVDWLQANRELLEQHGEVSYSAGPSDRDNPSAHLLVQLTPDEDVELLVWESGDAEFNRGAYGNSLFEHIELESPGELAELLARFLRALGDGA